MEIGYGVHPDTPHKISLISKNKWQWMADSEVDRLGKLFDSQINFAHMGCCL